MAKYKISNPEGVEIEFDLFVRDLLQIIGSGITPTIDMSDDVSTLVIKSAEDDSFIIETELGEEVVKVDTNAKTFEVLAPYSLIGGGGGGLATKSGTESAVSFTGNPKKATITFATAFADANYTPSASMQGGDNRTLTYESITASSFVINLNANPAPSNAVLWTAIKHGES